MRRLIGMMMILGVTATAGFGETGAAADATGPSAVAVSAKEATTDDVPVVVTKTVSVVTRRFSKLSGSQASGAEITIVYPEFLSSAGKNAAVDAINAAIMRNILTEEGDQPPPSSIEQLMTTFTTGFESALKADPEMLGGWSRSFEAKIRQVDEELVSLESTDSSFMGGAHPNSTVKYQAFSMKTGAPLALSAIVPAANMADLTRIAEGIFRKARGLKPEESLENAGFTFDKNVFTLNGNFLITKEGLSFFFNAYEIAPYSMGPTDLMIPWSEVKNQVDPMGPAGRFLTN